MNALAVEAEADATEALRAVDRLFEEAKRALRARIAPDGTIDPARLDAEQKAAHGLAWLEGHRRALIELVAWRERAEEAGAFGSLERAAFELGMGETLAKLAGGWPMSQGEIARLADLGLSRESERAFSGVGAVARLTEPERAKEARATLARGLAAGERIAPALADETLELVEGQFARFAEEKIAPHAHRWHLDDALIPDEVIAEIADMGVFGLSLPEERGGLGMSKTAMCVVTEALSRGSLGVGSLSTRSEIAGELIRLGGTEAQRERYLPAIASGAILPTAVFTEPDVGSDLASLSARATRDGEGWRITGAKTWITHASRADLMTVLARTDPNEPGYRGLSMFLIEKPRGTEVEPFPIEGLSGSEIGVLGYRGMKEWALSFDGLAAPADALLGGVEGRGFKQLMATFEAARIQTAARAVGVAQNALDLGLAYALERKQFGKPLIEFPRVADKLAWMAVETHIARQLTLHAARHKDEDRRCDLEAGLAKLFAAQTAWAAADNALQIHGGNGYALEYQISRVLCDSRILNIFEGAAEIQAQVVARRLLAE